MTTEELRLEYETLRDLLDKQLPKECGNCSSTTELNIHHIVPLSYGGSNRVSNLARLCNVCHSNAHGGFALVEKAAESRRENAKNGKHAAGSVPYGYVIGDGGKQVVDEDNAEIVRLIYRLRYMAELSTLNIASYFNHMAIPTVRGASKWSHPAITRMLGNAQYLGKSVYKGEFLGDDIYPAIIDGELAESIPKFEAKYKGSRLPPRNLQAYFDSLNVS